MFFIGVFGIENKEKEIKNLDRLSCKICNYTVEGKLKKNYDFFHFFFIPIFKWNERYFVTCEKCGSVYVIPKEKGKAIEDGEKIDVTYWDLQEAYKDVNYYEARKCSNCGNAVDKNFRYCPYCGIKI